MLQELRDASNLLRSALGQYLNISLAIRSQFKAGRAFNIDVAAALDELEKLDSYESTVNQCKKALATLRNGCPAVVPVNNLPPELLSRIFFFTISRECFYLSRDNALLAHSSKSPGSFLHVCSYCRSVALGSHGLWAHIDLDPFTAFMKSHVKAGELLSARSGHSPLFVHVNLDGAARIEQLEGMLDLCTTVAQRAISLELEYVDSLEPAGIKILAKLFASCTPGHLTKLAIWSHTSSPQAFIMANDSELMGSDGHNFWPLDVSSHHLEGVLQNVSVLRLEAVYPWWGSQAYHGLVKLHLTDSSGHYLSLSQLANILNASPQLRFLCIGTEIIEDTQPNPVRLDDLEVLQIEFGGSQLDSVLHLILPGSNPLRMSTALYGRGLSPDTLARGEHKRVFTRSTVVQLEAIWMSEDGNAYLDPRELPDLVPDLKVLRLRGVDLRLPPLDSTATARSPLGAQFTELRLSGSSIDPDVFQWVTNSYTALKVYIEERTCWISTEGRDLTDTEQWKEDWAEAYPMVQFVQEIGFAEESWD